MQGQQEISWAIRDLRWGTLNVPDWLTQELFTTILVGISKGDTIRNLSRVHDFDKGNLWRATEENPPLKLLYAHARRLQAHDHFERIVELAAGVESGDIDPNAARVALDARKWAACKLLPKEYGDKLETNSTLTIEAGDSIGGLLAALRQGEAKQVIELPAQPQPQLDSGNSGPAGAF